MRRLAADGTAITRDILVNTTITNDQNFPTVTSLADGSFVITWSSAGTDGSGSGVYGQRYNLDGTANGGEFQINTTVLSEQFASSIAALHDGGFVVTWSSYDQDGSGWGIYGQKFNADGTAHGGEFQVNTVVTDDQLYSTTTALTGGGFLVTWSSNLQDGSSFGVYGQRYNIDGTPNGGEFQINTYTWDSQANSSAAGLTDGGFVVTWNSAAQDGSGSGIYGQRFAADGTPVGAEFRVNTYTDNNQVYPSTTALADGGFVVSWSSLWQDGSSWGQYAQRFDANGSAVGNEFRINSATAGRQVTGSEHGSEVLTTLANGDLAAAFDNFFHDGYTRVIDVPDAPAPTITSHNAGSAATLLSPENATLVSVLSATDSDTPQQSLTWAIGGGENRDLFEIRNGNELHFKNAPTAGNLPAAGATADYQVIVVVSDGAFTDTQALTVHVGRTYTATSGADIIVGSAGNDQISGLGGNDWIAGGDGNDTLKGGNGDDVLFGGTGANQFEGGAGQDRIVVEPSAYAPDQGQSMPGNRADTVTDFVGGAAGDRIDISAFVHSMSVSAANPAGTYSGNPFANGLLKIVQVGQDTLLRADADWDHPGTHFVTLLTLKNVDATTLTADNFVAVDTAGMDAGTFQPVIGPLYPDQLVNTSLADGQYSAQTAALADGRYMVVWRTEPGASSDGSGYGIRGRVYDVHGTAVGGDFVVADPTDGGQATPGVTALNNGTFLTTWTADDGIFHGRIFAASGAPLGSGFEIALEPSSSAVFAAQGTAGFVAAYRIPDPGNPSLTSVELRRFTSTGFDIGIGFTVAEPGPSNIASVSVADLTDGHTVVAWTESGAGSSLHVRVLDQTGAPVTADILVQSSTADALTARVSALPGGHFLAVWADGFPTSGPGEAAPDNNTTHAQIFTGDGIATGPAFDLASGIANVGIAMPQIAVLADGAFVATWVAFSGDYDIYARAFAADGTPLGDGFKVNTTTVSDQVEPTIVARPDGSVVINWTSMEAHAGGSFTFDIRGVTLDAPACFLAGTMIRTPGGERAVETLQIGDRIMTADGRALPVKFIGRQTVAARFADPLKMHPVCIRAGALGNGLPARDLHTSPGHAMLLDGKLVMAGALTNGLSIHTMQQVPERFTYFHIELDEHAIIFAEGAPTETYCDNLPREVFDNHAEYAALYPDARAIAQIDLPTVKSARQLPRSLRLHLDEIAAALFPRRSAA